MRLFWMLCTVYLFYGSTSFAQSCGDLPAYSLSTAQQIYALVTQEAFGLNFKDARDGCDQRADKINDLMEYNKISGKQVYIQVEYGADACGATGAGCTGAGGSESPKLIFRSIYNPGTTHSWDFHTAPVICIQESGKKRLYVIDPSTFTKPVPLFDWTKSLSNGLLNDEYSVFVRRFR